MRTEIRPLNLNQIILAEESASSTTHHLRLL